MWIFSVIMHIQEKHLHVSKELKVFLRSRQQIFYLFVIYLSHMQINLSFDQATRFQKIISIDFNLLFILNWR